ncbi:MAG: CHAD domain-containing protein [Isosphaeraceae bacterium]
MKDVLPEKWINGATAGDRTGDVAMRSLQNRLGAVFQVLPLAARKAEENIEYVHQLRVWARRASAALDLYEDLLPRRRCAWMKKQLKRVRRAASDARDCDVLIERLRTERSCDASSLWLEELRAERSEKQEAVVTAEERLSRGQSFVRRSEKLLQRLQSRDEDSSGAASSPFGDWAPDRLRPLVDQFLAAVPSDRTDDTALHQFRIRGKQLRYAMELLAGAFSEEFRTKLYPAIEAIQDRLGVINDLATSINRLARLLEAATDSAEEETWQRLLASHRALFEEARQTFWDWCDSQRLEELRKGFETELGRVTQSADPPSRPPLATSEVLPPGGQLSDVLGAERTAEFLKFTLQTATEGLQTGRSEFLIRDEVTAELRHYIDTVHQGLLEMAAQHASLVVELALAARDMLLAIGPARDRDLVQRVVLRARKWEHRADELVNRCRTARGRGDAPGPVLDLLVTADDSADGLEEAIYWMSLLPDEVAVGMPVPLNDLAGLVLQGAQEYLKAVENARRLHRGSPREQVADFLEAVDRTLTVEHQTDEAHRRAQAGVLSFAGDYKQWHLVHGIADNLEEVADALLRSAMVLRDYILGEVLRR